MLAILDVRRATHGLVFMLSLVLAVGIAGDADASPKPKKPQRATVPLVAAAGLSAAPPVRFFTINEVLAKHDRRGGQEPIRLAAVEPMRSITDAPPTSASKRHPLSDEPFGLHTFRAPEGLWWVKWRGVEAQIREDAKVMLQCRVAPERCPSPAARRFNMIVQESSGRNGRAKIEVVNRAINAAIKYTSDLAQHGVPDQWSAPLASLASGRGDCEDYAIAKYVALREAGVAVRDLRLLLVRDQSARQDHAVLAVRNGTSWLMLDNRHSALHESAEVPHFTPLFALDRDGVKLFAARYAAQAVRESEGAIAPATAGPDPVTSGIGWQMTPYLL